MPKHYACFVFWRDVIQSLKPLQFSSNCIFQLPITFSSARALFPQAKHTLFRKGKKELARFQAPSLPICKPGLIWVSKCNAEVPGHITEAHSSDQTGSRLHISNHSNCVILKGSVMGNVWHDSNWERKKLSMHGSIPQQAGRTLWTIKEYMHFLAARIVVRPFAKQALVSQHAAMQCWVHWFSEVKTAGDLHEVKCMRTGLQDIANKILSNIIRQGQNSGDDTV